MNKLISACGLQENSVDLIVDFQASNLDCSALLIKLKNVPSVSKWRSFTVVSGAFPKDLTNLALGHHEQPRSDWNFWKECLKSSDLIRKPSYGDYTIQHAHYYEPVPAANVSASVRYTSETYWLIMRGQGMRTEGSAGSAQYPAHAVTLSKRKEFSGENFCLGDAFIAEKAKDINTKKTGNATQWLMAGINHHISFVVNQISNLS